jgi:mRNA interferase RelE/StbE
MDTYKIEWKRSATKELQKLPQQMILKIIAAVENLSSNPYPPGVRKLVSTENSYRIRIGDYRLVYNIGEDKLIVEIIRVRHRKDIYK